MQIIGQTCIPITICPDDERIETLEYFQIRFNLVEGPTETGIAQAVVFTTISIATVLIRDVSGKALPY